MKRFTQLFMELESSPPVDEQVAAVEVYLRETPADDAAWGLYLLLGKHRKRLVSGLQLRSWTADRTALADWLIDASYLASGDLGETLALLLGPATTTQPLSLHEIMATRILPLAKLTHSSQRALVEQTWDILDMQEKQIWHKLLLGTLELPKAEAILSRALAKHAGVSQAEMAGRIKRFAAPTADEFSRLLVPSLFSSSDQPLPFHLAVPLQPEVHRFASLADWLVEWKWAGIRIQLIKRAGQVALWSRHGEWLSERFPEIVRAGLELEGDAVLDGMVVAWEDGKALPVTDLARRVRRRRPVPSFWDEVPVAYMVCDLLRWDSVDYRDRPLDERRASLESLSTSWPASFQLSPLLPVTTWEEVVRWRNQTLDYQTHGLMFKHRQSNYVNGRAKDMWWKWSIPLLREMRWLRGRRRPDWRVQPKPQPGYVARDQD